MRHSKSFALAFALALAVPAAAAQAHHYAPGPTVTASPATSPFLDPCPHQAENPPDQVNYVNTEVEPYVAVNPTDPDNVIGVFQQDRWSDGGAHGLNGAISMNGGSTYVNRWAAFSSCSIATPEEVVAEPLPRATDPWVSFDASGRAYQIGLPIVDGVLGDSAITVSTSTDGGLSWTVPVDLTRDSDPLGIKFNDKQSITADPYHAGRAWATWIQGELPGEEMTFAKLANAFSFRGLPMVSRTTDGGETWTTPKPMTKANIYAQGNQIAVLPNGDLIDVQAILFKGAGIQPNRNAVYMAVMRSKDNGRTWSVPSKIAPLGTTLIQADGEDLRVGDYLPDLVVDPETGDIYVTWADGMGGAANKIVMSKSTDGGSKWSAPRIVSHHDSAHSFNHAIEAVGDKVSVLYYDIAGNTPADGIPTDVYLRHSADGGATWTAAQHLASYDFANAPVARGRFTGDYQGLAAIGADDLLAFFGVAGSSSDTADVVSIRLGG